MIDAGHLWLDDGAEAAAAVGAAAAAASAAVGAASPAEIRPLVELEREAILRALAAVEGNRRRAAELLGIGERTLYDKLKKYGIE